MPESIRGIRYKVVCHHKPLLFVLEKTTVSSSRSLHDNHHLLFSPRQGTEHTLESSPQEAAVTHQSNSCPQTLAAGGTRKFSTPQLPLGLALPLPVIRASIVHLLSGTGRCQSLCLQRECRSGGKQVPGGKIIDIYCEKMVRDGFGYPGRMKVNKKETCSPNNCIYLRTSKPVLLPNSSLKPVPTIAKII